MVANLALSYGLAAGVFIPAFVIAAVMLRAPGRALVLSLTFCAGAAAGYLAALASRGLLRSSMGAPPSDVAFTIFLAAAAIAGGVIAVFILASFSKIPPWQRS